MKINLRPVKECDCKQIFVWVNDPEVRKMFFTGHKITLKEHKNWFDSMIRDPLHYCYIAELNDQIQIGQIRFKQKDNEADVSVIIDPDYRGKGFGETLISRGSIKIIENTNIRKIHAYIKLQNISSLNSFLNAGYSFYNLEQINEMEVYHLIYEEN